MLLAMQQQFECMYIVFNEIWDCIGRQDVVIASWCEKCPQRVPYARRQKRHVHVDDSNDDREDEFEEEEDQNSLNGESRFVPRGERRGRDF